VIRAVRVASVIGLAIGAGAAVTMGAALMAHEFLVLKVGEQGIPAVDDTPLMFALVAGAYLAGGISGLAVLAYGWMRFLRRRT
jgi:hypothetical protein